jgi:hypothetical protein
LDKKRIKPVEYEVIIRKRKHRQEEGKESEVFLRGEVVSSRNIERYERNKTKKAGNSEQIVDSGKQYIQSYSGLLILIELYSDSPKP